MSTTRTVLDVSALPEVGFGPRSVVWWGTLGFMLIEGSTLGLCAITYFYLRHQVDPFPPGPIPAPALLVPTLGMGALLLSLVPSYLVSRAAHRFDRDGVRRWLLAGIVVLAVATALRVVEFQSLHARWDQNAYGTITWFILGFHFTLLALNVAESVIIAAIFFSSDLEEKHYPDAADNAFYGYFMVLVWVPMYLIVYFSPRLL